jgi:voltage-gated potassium channel
LHQLTPTTAERPHALRAAVYRHLDPAARTAGVSLVNLALGAAIVISVAVMAIETEPTLSAGREALFKAAEVAFATIFCLEYCIRFWVAAEDQSLGGGWRARWRWLRSPWALIDLAAFAPALLAGFGPSYLLRIVRLARIIRLAKLGRFSRAWSLLAEAVGSRRYELALTGLAALFVLLVSASLLYLVEGPGQPEKFGSIPRALWWSVVTLTTIGYGDVYPQTMLGKVLTGITAIIGVGLIATPAGILAGSFGDALQRQRDKDRAQL